MFWEDKAKQRTAARWVVSVFTACVLIYLGVGNLTVVTGAVSWAMGLVQPLLLGAAMALVLNVPMAAIEGRLFAKTADPKKQALRRPLAMVLAILFVVGIFAGVVLLVVPALAEAVITLAAGVVEAVNLITAWLNTADFSQMPYGNWLSSLSVDWDGIKDNLLATVSGGVTALMGSTVSVVGTVTGGLINFIMGLVFAIYILLGKEKLKAQLCRLIDAWLPARVGGIITHVAAVASGIFQKFIAGQTIEAVILGSLCALGMVLLRLPYAPMIGALVGVTALLPIVGAWIGMIVGAFMILTVNPLQAVIFVVYLLILQQVEGNLIYPKVVGSSVGLPAMWVLAAVTVGSGFGGIAGMLLAVPVASVVYTLVREATAARERRKAATAEEE
ncbi:MAG: AI-2E family transporter [Faecalibacterium sp.]|nr:AI-2E family transporter [Faecalibacterium sp.]